MWVSRVYAPLPSNLKGSNNFYRKANARFSQGQNLDLTVLYLPDSLDRGSRLAGSWVRGKGLRSMWWGFE